jgi:hypothetical protein
MSKKTDTFVQSLIKSLFYVIALDRPGFNADTILEQLDRIQPGYDRAVKSKPG